VKDLQVGERRHLYIGQHHPSPKDPPPVVVESWMELKPDPADEYGRLTFTWHVEVKIRERMFGAGGSIYAPDEKKARIDVLYEVIKVLADAAAECVPKEERR